MSSNPDYVYNPAFELLLDKESKRAKWSKIVKILVPIVIILVIFGVIFGSLFALEVIEINNLSNNSIMSNTSKLLEVSGEQEIMLVIGGKEEKNGKVLTNVEAIGGNCPNAPKYVIQFGPFSGFQSF